VELDKIYCADSRAMRDVDDGSVQLIVTSPPYNVGKDYAQHYDRMAFEEYLVFLNDVWKECLRVLCLGGRLAVNVANTWRKPYIPLNGYIARQLIDLGLQMRGEIIWDKGASAGISTAWGSFARASNPTLRDVHEYIMVFSKESMKLEETRGKKSGISNQEFVDWSRSIWRLNGIDKKEILGGLPRSLWKFSTHSRRRSKTEFEHPAVFPLTLPMRLILFYSNVGDMVLDPFMGSGTTALAAKLTRRHFIGYEISPEYCQVAEERLQKFVPATRTFLKTKKKKKP
jgi:modification methylase